MPAAFLMLGAVITVTSVVIIELGQRLHCLLHPLPPRHGLRGEGYPLPEGQAGGDVRNNRSHHLCHRGSAHVSRRPTKRPASNRTTKITMKIKNNVLAIAMEVPAMPVNPSRPAISATTRNIRAHFNIGIVPSPFLMNSATGSGRPRGAVEGAGGVPHRTSAWVRERSATKLVPSGICAALI